MWLPVRNLRSGNRKALATKEVSSKQNTTFVTSIFNVGYSL